MSERLVTLHLQSFLCLSQESIPEDEQQTLRHQWKREVAGMDLCDKHRGDEWEEIVPAVIPVAMQTGIHSRQAKPLANRQLRSKCRKALLIGRHNVCGELQWIPAHWSGRDDDGDRGRFQPNLRQAQDENEDGQAKTKKETKFRCWYLNVKRMIGVLL